MLLNILLLVAFISLLIYVKLKYFKSRVERMLLKVPGPPYNLLLGNILQVAGKREELYEKMNKLLGQFTGAPFVRIWVGKQCRIFITKAEAAEAIMGSTAELKKGNAYRFLTPWINDGLIKSFGAKWLERRRMITPTFHFRILEQFQVIMSEQASILADLIGQNGEEYFNIYPYISRVGLDIICETAMGAKLGCQQGSGGDYLKAISGMTETVIKRIFSVWFQIEWLFHMSKTGKYQRECLEVVHNYSKNVIRERKKEYLEKRLQSQSENGEEEVFGKKRRMALLDMLLEAQAKDNSIDDAGIQEEVDMFMFAGHDTTSSAMTWAIFNIARFPEIQEKIHNELDSVVGRDITVIGGEEMRQLKYLECVVKESLRLFPTAPYFSRTLMNDTTICGYELPAGPDITFSVTQIHTDPDHWKDPFKFDPDRFLPENAANRHPYAYVPFSAGSRNCIGQKFALNELKTVVAHVFHRYDVKTTTDFNTLKYLAEFVLRPANGVWIKVTKRI